MYASRFWNQPCCKIGSRYHLGYTSLAPLQSRITKPLVAGPGNWYVGEARIGGETVTVQSQSVLDDHDLQVLCHGRFPANCEGEEIRIGKLSEGTFNRIRAAFQAQVEAREEPIRCYVTYKAKFSTASALRAPATEAHVYAIEELGSQMMGRLEQAFPSTTRDHFRFRIEARQAEFDSKDGSERMTKVPDASLRYCVDHSGVYMRNVMIFQIGFREEYSSLKSSMKLWLDGDKHIKAALLIKLTEHPQYRTPIDVYHPPTKLQEDAQLPMATVMPKLVEKSGRILIHGEVFAHRMAGFCEFWVRNPDSGKAELQDKRIDFYDSDPSVKMEPPELNIDFDTYFPNLQELRGKSFTMDWRKMASEVHKGHKRTAIERYLLVLKRCRAARAEKP